MTDRFRIGFLSTVHPHPWQPTKGVFNQGMLAALAEAGADVSAVVPVPWTERHGPRTRIEPGYEAHYPLWCYLPRVAPLHLSDQMSLCTRATRRRVRRPDLILSYWTDPDGTVASRWAAELGVPFVQMVGGSDVLVLGNQPARRERMIRTLRSADRILTIGSALHRKLREWGINDQKLSIFNRGVDRSRFFPAERAGTRERLGLPIDRPILLWTGRLVDVKGVDVLLSALTSAELLRLNPLLLLLGDGPLRGALEDQARSTLPLGTVRFMGRVPHKELPSWYRAADLMVLPSRSEGVPNVLLEALACGTGFVASAVGSVPDLASDPALELVPPEDPASLAIALVRRLTAGPGTTRSVPDRSVVAKGMLGMLQNVIRERACLTAPAHQQLE